MAVFEWRAFLEGYSRELLADRRIRKEVSEAVTQSAWMGFDPAESSQILELEARIGRRLPDSYRQFLGTSNGWRQSGGFIWEVLSCRKVEWFRTSNQEWIDAYVEAQEGGPPLPVEEHCVYGSEQDPCAFRVEFLQSALQISAEGDAAVYLLNPEIQTESGEWEAWFFANWKPGANRHRSFWDLMQAECGSFVRLRQHEEKRYFPEDGIETLLLKMPGLVNELAEKSNGHRWGQQQRASRGRSAYESYTDGVIEGLEEAADALRKIAAPEASA